MRPLIFAALLTTTIIFGVRLHAKPGAVQRHITQRASGQIGAAHGDPEHGSTF